MDGPVPGDRHARPNIYLVLRQKYAKIKCQLFNSFSFQSLDSNQIIT